MTETTSEQETVLVTGATGFVGRAVVPALEAAGYDVRAVGRKEVGDIHRGTDWRHVLEGRRTVVHLAARVHVMSRDPMAGLEAFREVNLFGTRTLAEQALEAGVTRFVFVSSIKVVGESGLAVPPSAPPQPEGAYAISKAEAEAALRRLEAEANDAMGVSILRPPLVYGPGVAANFERMMRWLKLKRPLPLGMIRNQRSLIAIENFADAIRHAITAPAGTYHPKDPTDFATPELLRHLADGMGSKPWLLPVPVPLLSLLGLMTGQKAAIDRLAGSFTSDGEMAGWQAPVDPVAALHNTAKAFLAESESA